MTDNPNPEYNPGIATPAKPRPPLPKQPAHGNPAPPTNPQTEPGDPQAPKTVPWGKPRQDG